MSDYALVLSDGEVARYRMMAARARTDEADAWQAAGIASGAAIADVGCGPGAALLEMAEVVGPTGSVVGVDADPQAVATHVRSSREAVSTTRRSPPDPPTAPDCLRAASTWL